MDCLFCKIVNGEIPCFKIYEDDTVLAFLDINPDSNGHTLIIPKKHYLDLDSIDEEVLIHIMKTAKNLKNKISNKLHCDGMTLIQNNGDAQDIKHFHLHLKPYYNKKQDIKPVEEIFKTITD